jgi:hypothetical protein
MNQDIVKIKLKRKFNEIFRLHRSKHDKPCGNMQRVAVTAIGHILRHAFSGNTAHENHHVFISDCV